MKLAVVIVSYNTKEYLKRSLDALLNSDLDQKELEIIVVDNASSDGSKEEFQKNKKIIFIQNKENFGFSKANNIGVNKSSGEYVLFLNPDTLVEKDTLSVMIKFMEEQKDVGAATCKVKLENGSIDDASHRGFPTPWNSFCHFSGLSKIFGRTKFFGGYNLGWMNLNSVHEIDACAGAFMIVRREAGEEVGWWDEDFFFYGEDLDFCYRLKEKKWKIYYVPTCSILHYKGISHGMKRHSQHLATASQETIIRSKKERFAAMKIFYNKHYKSKYPALITWLVMKGINLKLKLTI